jgi:hypothetical protein
MKKSILILGLFVATISCDRDRYPQGIFPENPINLSDVNSPFDDINSDIPFVSHSVYLVFSTNRGNPQTKDFNLALFPVDFTWDKTDGILSVSRSNTLFDDTYTSYLNMIRRTESTSHEKGPYSFEESETHRVLMFSREVNGKYRIFTEPEASTPNAKVLNQHQIMDEVSNEMYPSFYGRNFKKGAEQSTQGKPEKLIFSSDRDGAFDIYEVDIPSSDTPMQFLTDERPKAIRKLGLNTASNDHMPFVFGDLLVFSSDRLGGFGGYDLYYSIKTETGWSEPVNMGPQVNSEYDEYRAIVSEHPNFTNRLMIFSSNRPGGSGGFDLYFVGIPKP